MCSHKTYTKVPLCSALCFIYLSILSDSYNYLSILLCIVFAYCVKYFYIYICPYILIVFVLLL